MTNRLNRILTISIVLLGTMLMWQCTSETSEEPSVSDTEMKLTEARSAMAAHTIQNSIIPSYEQLSEDINLLSSSWSDYKNNPSLTGYQSLQDGLKTLWLSWQSAAIYQMGPTETSALRVAINTYPTSTDKIEDNIIKGTWTLGSIANKDAEGLPALDYLLNGGSESSEESHQMLMTESGRVSYINDLIDALKVKIEKTTEDWQIGNFTSTFQGESASGTDVGSALGLTINAIDLHFQRFLRDGKIAIPAGIRSAGVIRPKATEALYGGYSKELLSTAISAYIKLFSGQGVNGTIGSSLNSYLALIGQESLSEDLSFSLNESLRLVQDLNESLSAQTELDNEKMIEVFMSLQSVVTLLKSDITSMLGITITNQDNDGD